jgi:16S rRNA (guanine527-N7)-methyltransferase
MQRISTTAEARARVLGNINATSDIENRLDLFVALLDRWRKITNLISPAAFQSVWTRHIEGCSRLTTFEPAASHWLDLGSGAGFPGVIIGIQLSARPDSRVHCVESDRRKCAFLREVVRATDIPVTVHASRIEDIGPKTTVSVEVVTGRALAPLPKLLKFSTTWIERGAVGLFPRDQLSSPQFTCHPRSQEYQFELLSSKTKVEGCVIRVRRGSEVSQ